MKDYNYLLEKGKKDGIEKNVIGAIIVNHKDEIIIMTRKQDDFMGGIDELPSGNMELGEDIITSLTREIKEETNLDLKNVLFYINSFDYKSSSGKNARQYNFAVEVKDINNIKLTEHEGFKWQTIEQLMGNENITEQVKNTLKIYKTQKVHQQLMKKAIEESKTFKSKNYSEGGPFGAVIVKNNEIISQAHNTVIESTDPTAHAEVNAIRLASKKLKTHDLSGCTLYTSAEPCPMCLSAIIWANIKEVYYANTKKDAENIGFRDDMIYEYIKGNKKDIIKLHHIESEEATKVFEDFNNIENKNMY